MIADHNALEPQFGAPLRVLNGLDAFQYDGPIPMLTEEG